MKEANVQLGIDAVEIGHFRRFVQQTNEGQLRELFTDHEWESVRVRPDPVPALAARFAVKEAVMKVLGEVDAFGSDWREIEVTGGGVSRPTVELHGRTRELASALGVRDLVISISHTRGLAVAVAAGTCAARSADG